MHKKMLMKEMRRNDDAQRTNAGIIKKNLRRKPTFSLKCILQHPGI